VFGWFRVDDFNLTIGDEPQFVAGATVTPSLAHSLGVSPVIGRWFSDESGIVLSKRRPQSAVFAAGLTTGGTGSARWQRLAGVDRRRRSRRDVALVVMKVK
jgi:hypothetical protein